MIMIATEGDRLGIAIKAGRHVAAVVPVTGSVAAVIVGDIGHSIAQQINSQGIGVFGKPLLIATEKAGCPICAKKPGLSRRESAGFIFAHHLGLEAHGLLANGKSVSRVYAGNLVAWVVFFQLTVVFTDQGIPDGGGSFGPSFTTKHGGP